jgi:hypothetical protein
MQAECCVDRVGKLSGFLGPCQPAKERAESNDHFALFELQNNFILNRYT